MGGTNLAEVELCVLLGAHTLDLHQGGVGAGVALATLVAKDAALGVKATRRKYFSQSTVLCQRVRTIRNSAKEDAKGLQCQRAADQQGRDIRPEGSSAASRRIHRILATHGLVDDP